MKFLIAATALLASMSAYAAQDLVRYTRYAGFSVTPGFETVVIQDDGNVRFHSEYRNRSTGKTDVTDKLLAKLTGERLAAMEASLGQIKADDLKDPNPGAPLCTDAPSTSIIVVKDNVEFARNANCHNAVNDQIEAVRVRALVEGMVGLSAM